MFVRYAAMLDFCCWTQAGPGEVVAPPGGSDVMQVMRVLLCPGFSAALPWQPLVRGRWVNKPSDVGGEI